MKKVIFVLLGVAAIFVVIVAFNKSQENAEVSNDDQQLPLENSEAETPLFAWHFEEADEMNLDGAPKTDIYLTATYSDGTFKEQVIDTVDGGCSELPNEQYEGDISNTGKVQCYYAGLGQQYRITKGSTSYLIERKFSEETLPDAIIPDYEWELVSEIYF